MGRCKRGVSDARYIMQLRVLSVNADMSDPTRDINLM